MSCMEDSVQIKEDSLNYYIKRVIKACVDVE